MEDTQPTPPNYKEYYYFIKAIFLKAKRNVIAL